MPEASELNVPELFDKEWPSIPEFYSGRSILITGGTGFMGKVLVEKLLRSCTDLQTIYLLLRPKKGKSLDERVNQITSYQLFDRLRTEQPRALDKLHVVSGDVSELGLGLSVEDRQLLQREVSVVFHSAASVRFDDSLRDAVLINVRGTRELLHLAQQMPRLEAFLHLSTIFCNLNQSVIREKIYPAPGCWKKMINFVENCKEETIHLLTPKIIGSLPNTYTYAKALSEQMINDYRDVLPVLIVRPSIVTSTAVEPMIGWVDNLNGPMGIWVGGYTGILRVIYVDPLQKLDFVSVDIAIKSMIFFAWCRAVRKPRQLDDLPIYNCCSMAEKINHFTMMEHCHKLVKDLPTMKSIWYPLTEWGLTDNYPLYYLCFIFLQLLPAILLDRVITAVGRKPMFVKLYRRIFIATHALAFFTTREFQFSNSEFLAAERFMLQDDKKDFSYSKIVTFDINLVIKSLLLVRELILKDPLSTIEAAKKRHKSGGQKKGIETLTNSVCFLFLPLGRLYFLDRGLKGGILLVMAWLLLNSQLLHSAVFKMSSLAEGVASCMYNL